VPKQEIDDLYKMRPYCVAPDGDTAQEAFAVIRDVLERSGRVALGRVVLTSREHVIALEARDAVLMGLLLRYPYEIVDARDLFADTGRVKLSREMIELGEHIVRMKSGHFDPEKFTDHYEEALHELIRKKRKGEPIRAGEPTPPSNVINVIDALRRSVEAEGGAAGRFGAPPPGSGTTRHGGRRRDHDGAG
jgi:DNA end-binding protein Ku